MRNLKPTWLELKQAGLVRYSIERHAEVINRKVYDTLARILREEYRMSYSLRVDTHQTEITQKEYDESVLFVRESFSVRGYEESATEEEIRKRIITRIIGK